MRYTKTFALSIAGLLTIIISLKAQDTCELKREEDNIRIYSCRIPGSALNAIRVEFEMNSTIERYKSVVFDIDNYRSWRYRETDQRILKRISNTELIYYARITAPFPVSDRDMVSDLSMSQDSVTKTLTVIVKSIPDYLPAVSNVVRVPKSISVMKLTPIGVSRLKASCRIEADPGGQIPAWVINSFSTQAPYETFKNLRAKMEGSE